MSRNKRSIHERDLTSNVSGRKGGFDDNGNYVNKRIYILKAEKALGRILKGLERVHHIDYDRLNNDNSNLVICPNNEYHKLLHIRTDALNATGNANMRRCGICAKYDDIVNLKQVGNRNAYYHRKCNADYKAGRIQLVRTTIKGGKSG